MSAMPVVPLLGTRTKRFSKVPALEANCKAEDRITKSESINKQNNARARRIGRGINPERLLINLTLSDGNHTDKTRVVFNDKKSRNYEMDCDAAKFMTLTQAPQLYSVEGKGTKFAINERPMGSVDGA